MGEGEAVVAGGVELDGLLGGVEGDEEVDGSGDEGGHHVVDVAEDEGAAEAGVFGPGLPRRRARRRWRWRRGGRRGCVRGWGVVARVPRATRMRSRSSAASARKRSPSGGEAGWEGAAVDEGGAEPLFEGLDAAAEGGLGGVAARCGAGEVAVFGEAQEVLQPPGFHVAVALPPWLVESGGAWGLWSNADFALDGWGGGDVLFVVEGLGCGFVFWGRGWWG